MAPSASFMYTENPDIRPYITGPDYFKALEKL
jgi:hypothetical protein